MRVWLIKGRKVSLVVVNGVIGGLLDSGLVGCGLCGAESCVRVKLWKS